MMRRQTHRRTARLAFILWPFLLCHALLAIDRDRRIDQLYHTGWSAKDGAPADIRALAQTTDGYLWLGTASGLFRFDGLRFEPLKPASGEALPQQPIYSLLAVPEGGLWVGFGGGLVCFLKAGITRIYGERDGVPAGPVWAMERDQQGTIWAGAGAGGLARLEGARWQKIGKDWNLPGTAFSLFGDRAGRLWVGAKDQVLFLPKGGQKFQAAAGGLGYPMKLGQASDGTLWMAETMRSVRPVPFGEKAGSPELKVGSQALVFDDQGSLWITTLGEGLRRIPNPGVSNGLAETFTRKDGLTGDRMFSVMQDREGNIWTGTNAGLDRFRQSPFVPVSLPPDAPITAIVEGDDSKVWVGMFPQKPSWIQAGIAKQVEGTTWKYMDHAYRDRDGVIWMADPIQLARFANEIRHPIEQAKERTRSTAQIDVPLNDGMVRRRVDLPASMITFDTRVKAITQDAAGRLWISIAGKGVFRLEGAELTSLQSLGGPKDFAAVELTDAAGRIWFGYANDQLTVLDGAKSRTYGRSDGLLVGEVRSLQSEGRHLWVGGTHGLALFADSRFLSIVPAHGGTFTNVTGMIAGEDLWLNERRGVIRISSGEIKMLQSNPEHRVEFEVFDLLDGLPAQRQGTSATPSAIKTADGLHWFATPGGLAWMNPKRFPRNRHPPSISIEGVKASGRDYNPSKYLELPARAGNVQITYTALSLTMPERVRFRYRMEGADETWQDVGTRREAFYTNLGPGTYHFRVIACNNDGVWNEAGATLNFMIAPAYYQTWWFQTICGIAVAGILWLLYLLRVQQVTVQVQARLGERLAERERIARELHDTLLQSVQGLMLHFEAVMKRLPPQEPTRIMVEKALHTADQVLLEGRDRVRDLRSKATPATELSLRLSECGAELAQDHPVSFQSAVMGSIRELDPIVHDEVYRIGREALLNAFRHSQASLIEIEITYDSASLHLRVRDNGTGVSQETLNRGLPGHWGLSGMRERAQKLGGEFGIWSRPGAGTEIDLTIPAQFAYPHSERPSMTNRLKRALFRRGN